MGGINWLISLLRRATLGGDGDPHMTADRALSYAPVWYSVNKIAGHVARLPLNLHRINGKENKKITNHLGYRLLRVRSNSYQTPFVFKRQLMAHALLWGNGRAYIHRDGLDSELIPLMPDRCETVLVQGEKFHFYKHDRDERLELWSDISRSIERSKKEGDKSGVLALHDSEVVHIPGLGFDGVQGYSLIRLASQSWGIGLGAENQERKKQRKGYSGGLMLEAPAGMLRQQKDAEEFLEFFRKHHDGEDNAGKTGLLRDGVKANVMAMSNQDAQFIEQRKFQRQDAALWFLLESILGDDSSVSYNSLEQKNLAYLQNCLGGWLTVWEEECEAKLLTLSEIERGFYFKFNDGALLRTDKQTTATIVSTLINARVINPNEGREMFDMNPYDGGDEYANPAITPGGTGGVRDPKDNPVSAPTKATETMILKLINVEIARAKAGCTSRNFCDWVDRFYSRWEKTLSKAIEGIEGDSTLAKNHCEESKRLLFDCAGSAKTATELVVAVEQCVASWGDRAKSLAYELELALC